MANTNLTIDERIDRGVAYLDQHKPDWLDTIRLDFLELDSECNCVLGQVVGGGHTYWDVTMTHQTLKDFRDATPWPDIRPQDRMRGAVELGFPRLITQREAVRMGFHTADNDHGGLALGESPWRRLTSAWKRRITQLREERS
jgi:hypothetical protein